MKIERIDLRIVKLPMIRSFATSSSQKNSQTHILIKAYADGLVGWGEAASPADPFYCEETYETCWHILERFLAPAVLGKEWSNVAEFKAPYQKVKRNNFAKAGIEMAAWDLLAQAEGKPLHALLGGTRSEILSGVSLGIESDIQRTFDQIDQYIGEGYRRVKLKIGPGNDVSLIAAVRERYPDLALMADANSAYRLSDIPLLKELDQFGLTMIEQPLAHDDIVDHAKLQAELETPICLDESIITAEDARKALDLGSGRVINIKVSRVGGLSEAIKVHDVARERGIPVWAGGMHEMGVGRAANVALCTLPGFTFPGDVSGSDKYYAEDIVDPSIRAIDGAIAAPTSPGLGWSPNEARIEAATERFITLIAGN